MCEGEDVRLSHKGFKGTTTYSVSKQGEYFAEEHVETHFYKTKEGF